MVANDFRMEGKIDFIDLIELINYKKIYHLIHIKW